MLESLRWFSSYRGWAAAALVAATLVPAAAGPRPQASKSARPAAPPAAQGSGLQFSDLSGKRYGGAELAAAKASVFLFVSTQCPVANIYAPRMAELERDYRPKGVLFFLVDSNPGDTPAGIKTYARERGLGFPAVKDRGTELADRLGASVTPEAVIVDPRSVVRYRGRIDDNQDREQVVRSDVRAALDDLLAGREVARPRTLAAGCAIFRDRPAAAGAPAGAQVTYTQHVAAILNQNCVVCHRKGEVGPFALDSYAQARTWAASIKEYTARRLMPPWKAVPGHGEFHDARSLSDQQIALLGRWAETGAPEGDAKWMPPAPSFPPAGTWSLGKPDVVVQPEAAYQIPAEGRDIYRNFVMPIEFKEDTLLSGIAFKPDNRAVVHHIVTYIDPSARSVELDAKDPGPGYSVPGAGIGILAAIWGEVWVPGNEPRLQPPGVAIRIPKGSRLVMQVHYHMNGRPQSDRSQMALYYSREKDPRIVQTWPLGNMVFEIKPGEARSVLQAQMRLPMDIELRSIFPHMHMLGREMNVTATLPDGKKLPLILINDWDFNWQATYYYKQPLVLPRGTNLELTAAYDNSEKNPRQHSHPPRSIRFGEQTTDEMCFAFLGFTTPGGAQAALRHGPDAGP